MRYGSLHEADAVNWYECERGVLVRPVGFVAHPEYDWCGVSPDGYVDTGRIEVKCPVSGVPHNEIPAHYIPQCVGVLHITGGEWIDFISWSPGEKMVQRIDADESLKLWKAMEAELVAFWNDYVLADVCPAVRRKNGKQKV